MPSRIETATAAYRDALTAQDAAAQTRLIRTYQAGQTRLRARIASLRPLLQTDPTPARVFADARYRALLSEVTTQLAGLGQQLTLETTARQQALVDAAGPLARGLVGAQAPDLAASFAGLPARATQELVGSLSDGSPLAETVGRRFGAARNEAEDALSAGVISGQGPADLARTLAGITDGLIARHVLTLARTAPMQAFRTASLQTYAANADVVTGWIWMATLSGTTCLACLNKHGTVHPVSEQFFGAHPRCRCVPIPRVRGHRSPAFESGQHWFDRQPAAAQRRQMGIAAHQAYRQGDVRFRDFLGERNDPAWGATIFERSLTDIQRTSHARAA